MYQIPGSPKIDLSELAETERLLAEATTRAHRIFAGGKSEDGNIEIRHLSRFDPDTETHIRSLEVVVTTTFRHRHTFTSIAEAHEFVKAHHAEVMAMSSDATKQHDAIGSISNELAVLDTLVCLHCDEKVDADIASDLDYVLVCPKGHVETIPAEVAASDRLARRTKK